MPFWDHNPTPYLLGFVAPAPGTEPLPPARPASTPELPPGFKAEPTGDAGIHSGRPRYKVTCERCGELVHPNTTGPESMARAHRCPAGAPTPRPRRANARRTEEEMLERLEQMREKLAGWSEPDGFYTPTEPDADERARVRDRMKVHIQTLEWVLGQRDVFE